MCNATAVLLQYWHSAWLKGMVCVLTTGSFKMRHHMLNPKVLRLPEQQYTLSTQKYLPLSGVCCCLNAICLQCKRSPAHAEDHTFATSYEAVAAPHNMRHVCRCVIIPSCWQTLSRRTLVQQMLCQASLWSWTNYCAIYTATTTRSCCCHIIPRYPI